MSRKKYYQILLFAFPVVALYFLLKSRERNPLNNTNSDLTLAAILLLFTLTYEIFTTQKPFFLLVRIGFIVTLIGKLLMLFHNPYGLNIYVVSVSISMGLILIDAIKNKEDDLIVSLTLLLNFSVFVLPDISPSELWIALDMILFVILPIVISITFFKKYRAL